MKKLKLFIASLIFMLPAFGQQKTNDNSVEDIHKPVFVAKATSFHETIALRDMVIEAPKKGDGKHPTVKNKIWGHEVTNPNPKPYGTDPVWQKTKASHSNRSPIQNWEGIESPFFPPDPSGAVGPNHYVQMINMEYQIFDKEGNSLFGPVDLGSLLGGDNTGDPIAMYDKAADRWFLSQFGPQGQDKIIIAISQTPDPVGEYYVYEFPMPGFPDYPKFAVWQDGYYLTANIFGGANRNYAMDRTKMLAGDPDASIQGFVLPDLNPGNFFGVLPTHASSSLPAEGTPNYFVYMQDDNWTGVSADHIKVWELSIDWENSNNSNMSDPIEIPTSAFDTEFKPFGAGDVEQPGTNQKLDAFSSIVMYMAQYREFEDHKSIVMNFAVDVNAGNVDHIGVRWVELRKIGDENWTLYQEGTFAPDEDHRWCASIHQDYKGNIALAYHVSGAETYLSLRYTGRYAADPLGQMTFEEETIIDGTNSQTNLSRNGDYSQMTIDPTDDATFWYTGEYFDGGRKTRIASFRIAPSLNNDVGATSVNNPVDGILGDSDSIKVTIFNFGIDSIFNFPVSYQVNDGAVVTEMFEDTIYTTEVAEFTFAQTADFSEEGSVYSIKAYTGYELDEYNPNDTTVVSVKHLFQNDIGVSVLASPASGFDLTDNENIEVTINNFGGLPQSDFMVYYVLNDGIPVEEQFVGELAPDDNVSFTFTETVDFSFLGFYGITTYTSLIDDADLSNDTNYTVIEHFMCMAETNCSFGDGFTEFKLGEIDNPSGCGNDNGVPGYSDFTNLSTNLEQGSDNEWTVMSGYADQFGTVWIDFNDNANFESDEIVVSDFPFGESLATASLSIPEDAPLGEHRLRARTNWLDGINDPCENVTYGETEDYTVVIIEPVITGINQIYNDVTFTVNTLGNGRFEFIIEGLIEKVNIEVQNSIGQSIYNESNVSVSGSLNYKIDLSNQSDGFYVVKIGNENFTKSKRINKAD